MKTIFNDKKNVLMIVVFLALGIGCFFFDGLWYFLLIAIVCLAFSIHKHGYRKALGLDGDDSQKINP